MTSKHEGLEFTIGESYIVRRSHSPIEVTRKYESGPGSHSEMGGQTAWFWGVPGVFHALASPRTGQPVPAPPLPTLDEAHSQSLGYWCALQYLFLYRLGWSDPGKGLTRWYDIGKPTDDPTLALVAEVWDRDGHLDRYLAWLLQRQPRFLDENPHNGATEAGNPERLDPAWSAWLRATTASLERSKQPYFSLTGGTDNLHLTGHAGEGGKRDPHSRLSILDSEENRALFVTDTLDAWYWDLRSRTLDLPLSSRSWRIDVFVRPVGFLGNYRLSRSTSLLFAGRHRYHSMGN